MQHMKRLLFTIVLAAVVHSTTCARPKRGGTINAAGTALVHKTGSASAYVGKEDKADNAPFFIKPVSIDTTWGDWQIHVRQFYNGRKFVHDKETYADYAVNINVFKAGKPVFKDYKVDSKSLMGGLRHKGFHLSLYQQLFITPTSVYVGFAYCEPESDNCAENILALSSDGTVRIYQTDLASAEGEMDMYVTDVYWFYAFYVNELSQARPSTAAISQVLGKYCTKAFAQRLQSQTLTDNLLLGSPQFDHRWLRSFEVHDMDEATHTCIVNYKRADGTMVYKRLHLQLKPDTEYEYLIDGVTDATANDLPHANDETETP